MSEVIGADTVRHLAHLARLELDDAEIERFTRALSAAPRYVARLDGVQPGLERTQALKKAPAVCDDRFPVPKVIE